VFCSPACKEAARSAAKHAAMVLRRAGRRCIVCDAEIPVTMSSKARCCSKQCSVKYQNDLRQAAKNEAKARREPCAHCGGAIPPDRRNGVMYCSAGCKKKAHDARWRLRAPHYMRQYLYGITAEEYTALLEAQGNRCAICRSDEWPGKDNQPHVDHCHVGGQVRGLLCGRCNNGLGQFKDDPVVLRAAAAYLERHM
jgi:hypothetical protein